MSSHDTANAPSGDRDKDPSLKMPPETLESLKTDTAQPVKEHEVTASGRARHGKKRSVAEGTAWTSSKAARSRPRRSKKSRSIRPAARCEDRSSESESDQSNLSESESESDDSEIAPPARGKKPSRASRKSRRRRTKKNGRSDKLTQTSDSDTDSSASDDSHEESIRPSGRRRIKHDAPRTNQIQDQLERLELRLLQIQTSMASGSPVPNVSMAAGGIACSIPQLASRPSQALSSNSGFPSLTLVPPSSSSSAPLPGQDQPDHAGRADKRTKNSRRAVGAGGDTDVGHGTRGDDSKETRKRAKPEFKRVDSVWDTSRYAFKLQDTAETTSKSRYDQYIFHVRRTFDTEGKYRATFVDIKSKLLRECLQDVIGNTRSASLVDETPKIDPNLLFLYLEDFRTHLKHLRKAEAAGDDRKERQKNCIRLENKMKQLKVLIKYLDKDYAKVKESLYPMLDSGVITFDLLWALWKPNTIIYGTTYGNADDHRAFKVEMAYRQCAVMRGTFYIVEGRYLDFDGKRFGLGSLTHEIPEFQGTCKITSLPCYPLKYRKDESMIREHLIARGRRFVGMSGVHFRSYSGIAYMRRKKSSMMKFNIQQSRVMVDPAIFRRFNPNYGASTIRAKDHDFPSEEDESENDSAVGFQCGASDVDEDACNVEYVSKVVDGEEGQIIVHIPKSDTESSRDPGLEQMPTTCPDKDEVDSSGGRRAVHDRPLHKSPKFAAEGAPGFSEEYLLIASPVVLGFAFSEKQWLEFSVSGIGEVKWNDKAWESLVLEPATKDLIRALVQSRKYHAAQTIDDVIQGKGKGLVTVLHGPPGTGKTLTAEGISELLKCPLYMVSAGELGTDSRVLEAELQRILDICHAWGAILLLDEADVFLETRNMQDIHRNALVSIFLRQLEYFQGILFLTTNRVQTFDEAFQSRIHIALRYDALDHKAKKAIFRMFLDRIKALGKIELGVFTDEDFNSLARRNLNGREIKNVMGSAQDLAVNKGEALCMRHIRQVLDVHTKFDHDLRGGSGYEDAMRSFM
ncbi:ATPase, AAA-type, core [Purpureocillium lavendulum]|uniref:ATPase, AAA-type, core n=1 Tax=Purpureocillium lavendulum TaxID=1247861 RepID=A0AB34FVK2_9HYPO|nr:ATPase, AAA-type, core [Purpureocillium lavendulum]